MHIDAINEIAKGLTDEQEDSLLAHAAVSVSKAIEGADDETARKHVSSFLCLLRANEPELFENGSIEMPDSTLEKDADNEDSWQSHLKGLMHDQGHHYFGELEKHYWGEQGKGPGKMDIRGYGPLGAKNPKKSPTHSYKKPQEVHGRGSGKRTLMGYIRAYAKKHGDEDVPTWNEMKAMEHEEVIEIADDLNVLVETRGPTLRVVDTDGKPNEDGENKLRGRDIANYVGAPKRGQGNNVTQDSAARHIDHIERENEKLDGLRGKKKTPIRDAARRVGIKRRKNLTPKEQVIERGRRRYGAYDPNNTLADQPKQNRSEAAAEQKRMRDQLARVRAISPKVDERDLPDAPQDRPRRALPDPQDANEAIDRNKRRTVNATPKRKPNSLPVGDGSVPPSKRPKGADSKLRARLDTLEGQQKVDEFERIVKQRQRLKNRIDSIKQNDGEVPNQLAVQYRSAQKRYMVAYSHLKNDEMIDRNQLRRLRDSIERGGDTEAGKKPVTDKLATPRGWRNPEATAKTILDELRVGKVMPSLVGMPLGDGRKVTEDHVVRGGTFDVSKVKDLREDHKTGYYVSEKGREQVIDGQTPTDKELADYLTENREAFENGGLLGIWKDGSKTYLDVSHHFTDEEEARVFGRENDQLAVWDIAAGVNMTPKMPEGLTDDLRPRTAASQQAVIRQYDRNAAETHDNSDLEAMDMLFDFNGKKDTQQYKLYEAEGPFNYASTVKQYNSIAELQARTDEIVASDFWKRTFPEITKITLSDEEPTKDKKTGKQYAATGSRYKLEMRFQKKKKLMNEAVLLHELAHLVTPTMFEGHGPEYAKNHNALQREFRGDKVADDMLEAYKRKGVKVSDRPAGSFLPDKAKRGELNNLLRQKTRLKMSMDVAMDAGDTALVAKIRKERKALDEKIKALGDHAGEIAEIKEKGKRQADRLSANTRGTSDRISRPPVRTSGTSKGRKHVDYEWMADTSILDTPDQARAKDSYSVRFVQAKDGNGWMATVMVNGRPIKGTSPVRSEKNTAKAARDLLRAAGAGS